jgi:MacB-like periplasmic core domain
VLSLALGVAVTTTAYSVLYALLWKPLGVRDPARVAVVTSAVNGWQTWRGAVPLGDFESLRDRQRSFGNLAASASAMPTIDTPRASEMLPIEAVTPSYFSAIGAAPAPGRVIQPTDDARSLPVMVLSAVSWRRDFHSDPAIVGKAVRIGSQPFEIVGVLQPGYEGLHGMGLRAVTGWVPLSTAPMVTVVGRLGPAQDLRSAAVELETIGKSLDTSNPARVFRALDGSSAVRSRGWSVQDASTAARPPLGGFRFDYLLLFITTSPRSSMSPSGRQLIAAAE